MQNIERIEKLYEKEMEAAEKHKLLYENHKKKASDYKEQWEIARGLDIQKRINRQNLSGEEFDKFMELISSQKTIIEALKLVDRQKGDQTTNET
ncbi:hypothetical protein [Kineothrix sedimenti]|uniref:DUF3847 domain-containing protein n=1 Tax=Kineothrix sedimenti TaxID=3123317 RepID=A0ABZ3EQ49_9FIRM